MKIKFTEQNSTYTTSTKLNGKPTRSFSDEM